MDKKHPLETSKSLPNGARFYRTSLQVNPYEYLIRHSTGTTYTDEDSYNSALIDALTRNKIEVIAVTDHYRIDSSVRLIAAAEKAGIVVFKGFEAVTKDGVHLLCLFDPSKEIEYINRILGDCGIHSDDVPSPLGKYDVVDFLQRGIQWGCICVAAHVASDGGLLRQLKGQSAVTAWKSKDLLACALPGAIVDAPDNARLIIQNKNEQYKRERPITVINAQDINDPSDIEKSGAWCYIKMTYPSVEGIRQAFLDSTSRIRLISDQMPEEHQEFVSITWQGGFLSEATIRFNQNLNVLVGGRGSGKSTIIESIRYVIGMNPIGQEAKRNHDDIIQDVLQPGTKISLMVRSYRPSPHNYLIERTVPNPPIVRDFQSGQNINIRPLDILSGVEVYGQHEISEIARSPEKLTSLLKRFIKYDPEISQKRIAILYALHESRQLITNTMRHYKDCEEQLSQLPVLIETLKRYNDYGLEERLSERTRIIKEDKILAKVQEQIYPFRNLLNTLEASLPIETSFLSPEDRMNENTKIAFNKSRLLLQEFNSKLLEIQKDLKLAISDTENHIQSIQTDWEFHKEAVEHQYETILRELQKEKIDGAEFVNLRKQVEELRPLNDEKEHLQIEQKTLIAQRRSLVNDLLDLSNLGFQELNKAAKKVSRKLRGKVRVKVTPNGSINPLIEFLKNRVGGRLAETIEALKRKTSFSITEFALACQEGVENLISGFGLPESQAERICKSDLDVLLEIDEIELPTTTSLELNIAPEGQEPNWQALQKLSTGQKATAVLLLLLLESDEPLVVDQPEDDLDNRFITESIVPKMRDEKQRRQFIFSTHNANIPVLGDAELIMGLVPRVDQAHEQSEIPFDNIGSIDSLSVQKMVEEVLEGGKQAFEMRRLKYGF